MEKLEDGCMFFFNKGKYIRIPLKYYSLSQSKLTTRHSKVSRTEEKFISKKEGETYDEKLYNSYIQKGYSMLRIMPIFLRDEVVDNQFLETISIAPEITKQDADNIREVFNELREEYKNRHVAEQTYIHNITNEGPTYYYHNGINNEDVDSTQEFIQTFMRYKLGETSKQENEIIKKYLNFDLRDIFLSDNSSTGINHRNEAVVMITSKGNRYSETKKKRQHKDETQEMIRNKLKKEVEDIEVEDLALKYNLILIRIFKTDRNMMVIHTPTKPTVEQLNEFATFLTELETIDAELKEKGKMPILIAIEGNERIRQSYEMQAGIFETKNRIQQYLQLELNDPER